MQALARSRWLQESRRLFIADFERRAKEGEAEQQFTRALGDRVQALAAEASQVGATRIAVEQLAAAREIDRQVLERVRQTDDVAAQSRAFADGERAKAAANREISTRVLREENLALDGILRDINAETAAIGATNAERQTSILLRQLETSGIEAGSAAYDELVAKIKRVGKALDLQDAISRQQRAFEDLGQAGGDFAARLVTDLGNARDAVDALGRQVLAIFTRELIAEPFTKAITGILRGGADSGSGLGGFLAGLFSGGFADGGFIAPGRGGVVGERGPELAFGGRSGQTIAPVGGPTVNVMLPAGFTGTRQSVNQMAGEVVRRLAVAGRRYA